MMEQVFTGSLTGHPEWLPRPSEAATMNRHGGPSATGGRPPRAVFGDEPVLNLRFSRRYGGSVCRTVRLPLLLLWLVGALTVAGCGSDEGGLGMLVERPGKFQVELPTGWRIILPAGGDDDRTPIFSAAPTDPDGGLLLFLFSEQGSSLEATAQVWRERTTITLGDFKRKSASAKETMTATGTGVDRATGKSQGVVMAVMRSPQRPEEMWIFSCVAPDLGKSGCERLVGGFTLLP